MARDRGSTISTLGYGLAVTLVVASLLNLARALDLFGAPPVRGDGQDFVEFLLQVAAYDHDRLALYDAAALLFGIAFLALAALGFVLGPVGAGDQPDSPERGDGARRLLTTAFVVAGTLGVASQLADIGVTAVAANPTYCDCGYLAEEIVGRLQAINTGFHVSGFLRDGALLIGAGGFALLAVNGLRRRAMNTGKWLALTAAILLVLYVLAEIADLSIVSDLILLAATLIVIPAWAVLLARRAGDEPIAAWASGPG